MPSKTTSFLFISFLFWVIGCSAPPAPSSEITNDLQANKITNQTSQQKEPLSLDHIFLSAKQNPENAPFVILMHGYGSNANSFGNTFGPLLTQNFNIITVRAPHVLREGAFSWYGLTWDNGKVIAHNEQEEAEAHNNMLKFVSEVNRDYNTNNNPIYLVGFSQGAMMALNLTMQYPDIFKGAAILSGRSCDIFTEQFAAKSDLQKHAIFLTHGTEDSIIDIEEGRKTKSILEQFPSKLTYTEYPIGHTLNQQLLSDLKDWFENELKSIN